MRFDIQKFFASIFAPPFRGLPVAVWVYYVFCFLAHPASPILRSDLPDADDYMYLAQVSDWLNGQSWFDLVQHRLNPPEGTLIDFSRLAQVPMTGLILLLRPFFGMTQAGIIMAAVWPPVLMALLFFALRWAADNFMDQNWSRVTSFIALFATYLAYLFSPGHIDHHGLTALLVTISFGFTARMFREPWVKKWAIGAGFFSALALAVALESLPWLIVVTGWIGLWSMQKGRNAARAGSVYGLTLYLASAAFLAATKLPSHWFDIDTMAYSIVYVFMAGGIAVCFAGIAMAANARTSWRYLVGVALAIITGGLFFYHFPELKAGPYGAMNPALAKIMFDSITEAMPIIKSGTSAVDIFLRLIWPLMGLASALFFLRRAKTNEDRWIWGLINFALAAFTAFAAFYQIRCLVFAQLFTIFALAAALRHGMVWLNANVVGRALGFMQLGLVILIAPLPMLIFPALVDGRPYNTGVLLFPVVVPHDSCEMQPLAQVLNKSFGAHPRLIMDEMDAGAELLFRAKDSVLSAPFHTDVSGNLDSAQFFSTFNPEEAESIMRRRNAELVVMCRATAHLYHDAAGKSFAEQLVSGPMPPWI